MAKYTWKEIEHHREMYPHQMNTTNLFEVLLNVWNKYSKEIYHIKSFTPSTYYEEKTNNFNRKYVIETIQNILCELSDRKDLTREQIFCYNYISSVWCHSWECLKGE